MKVYRNIGIMSGTSLDGVDIACCELTHHKEKWDFRILQAETIHYNKEWKTKLSTLHNKSSRTLIETHFEYGNYLGRRTNDFVHKHQILPDLICSHGHTIFHQPGKNFTFQLGSGQAIAATSGVAVVSDFRTKDILYGGQGAPLVPAGDELLFPEYASCLNLGGFSNISFRINNQRVAFDISPANMALNHISKKLGFEYDKDGTLSAQGLIDENLLARLNGLDFYRQKGPKSLGREWFEEHFLPLIENSEIKPEDRLRTVTEHIAVQISRIINQTSGKCLVTGGGAFNVFLMKRLRELSEKEIVVPAKELVSYKEALVFGLLGALRYRNEINCLSSVTGASIDTSCGVVHYP